MLKVIKLEQPTDRGILRFAEGSKNLKLEKNASAFFDLLKVVRPESSLPQSSAEGCQT
jgi:hypothetical protein